MFTDKVVESDAFTDMPLSAQALYFHFNMEADDDGFVNNPKRICRSLGASEDDLKILIGKRFLLSFESGIIAIKHWRMHNLLRKDRYTETQYKDEKNMLILKENGAYTEADNQMATKWQPNGNQMATQVSISKGSKVECKVVEVSGNGNHDDTQPVDNSVDNSFSFVGGELGKGVVLLTDAQQDALLDKLGFDAFNHYVDKLSRFIIKNKATVSNHYSTILKWASEDAKV
jgi:hypothetical protein